jgi:polyhydroxyalkanoate synthesis repressor PhaR
MPRRIKRYSNRKLYDTIQRRYITLQDISRLVSQGETVEIVDHDSGQDVTAVVLAQVVADQERRLGGVWPNTLFARLVQVGEARVGHLGEVLQAFLSPEEYINQCIHKRILRLQALGRLTEDEATRLLEWLLDPDLELMVDESLPVGEQSASQEEFARLVAQVDALERVVESLSGRSFSTDGC